MKSLASEIDNILNIIPHINTYVNVTTLLSQLIIYVLQTREKSVATLVSLKETRSRISRLKATLENNLHESYINSRVMTR